MSQQKHTIYLDCTTITVVVRCRTCEHWAAMRFTKLEGWKAAAAHEERAHPSQTQARDALSTRLKREARHAATVI